MDMAVHLPRDARLPQLARAVDAEAMRQVFDAALAGHGAQRVTGCRVDRVKYRPGRNCTVSYRLRIRDEHRSCSYEQRAAGRFCPADEAARRQARSASVVKHASRCGKSSLLLPELGLFAWFLPNDPKLSTLPVLLEAIRDGGSALAEALAVMTGEACNAGAQRAALLQYVPESRACARFDVRLGRKRRARLYAKISSDGGGAATQRLMQALYDSPACRDGLLRVPRPLLWQQHSGLHWQAALPGLPLLERHPHCPPTIAAAVGALAAALHDTPVPQLRRLGSDQLLGDPTACARMLGSVEPAWNATLDRLMKRLEDDAAGVRSLPHATLHGDLHPRNILIDGTQLSLVDLDGLVGGPAVLELGSWIADSLYRAMLSETPLENAQHATAALLDAYTARSRQPVEGRPLAWATARALLCERAYRGVANLKPGRFERVPALLTLACRIADNGDVLAPLPS